MKIQQHLIIRTHIIFLYLLLPVWGASQINGRVTDAHTGEPLAFVNIIEQGTRNGTMTDIDGAFSLKLSDEKTPLQLSYVGYFGQTYPIKNPEQQQQIKLHRRPYELEEVIVYPGENPAHRIVKNAINNRSSNDPEKLEGFIYTSYNKFLATLDQDFYLERWEMTGDSSQLQISEMLNKRHLFIMESVSERKFKSPNQSNEIIIANRVSGLENPMFSMLATELQPFSFYGATISLLENEYISPLNRAAFNRYFYNIEDTLYWNNDTVFVIAFRPARNTNFDGLSGLLYINTFKWAIQNVIAQPARAIVSGLSFRIQQKYELIDNKWFPTQLNTDIDFFNPEAQDPTAITPIRMLGRSYIKNIAINPPLSGRDFGPFSLDFSPQANNVKEAYWQTYRPDTISPREKNTYQFMDSLGNELNFDAILNSVEPLAFGEIPLGVLNIPINSIYRFNDFEKHRLGLGLATNNRFSKRFHLGGHYAWGTGDRKHKYGYFGSVVINKRNNLRLGGAYNFDVSERGGSNIMLQNFILNTSMIRNFYMNKMDYTRRASAFFSFHSWRNFLTTEISVSKGKTHWTDLYYFTPGNNEAGLRQYHFTEAMLRLRFAYGEKLANTPLRIIRLPSNYPVFYLNITNGLDNIGKGETDYWRFEGRIDYQYNIPLVGKQSWILEAGSTNQKSLPWPLLFTAKAGNRDFYLASPFSFGTMQMNEFAANQYAAVFFQHSFQNLLFRKTTYTPELVIIANAGFGKLLKAENHLFMPAKSWEKGYYESGFAINKILPQRWARRIIFGMSPGIELLYRFGPYSLPTARENITVKLSLVTSF